MYALTIKNFYSGKNKTMIYLYYCVIDNVLFAPGSVVTSPTDVPMGVVSPPPVEWGIPQPQKLK